VFGRQNQFVSTDIELPAAGVADELGKTHQLFLSLGSLCLASCPNSVLDPVGQQLVLLGAGLLLKIVGHTGGDSIAGDFLAAFAGKENKQEVRMLLPNGPQELEPTHIRHIVIRDDAIRRAVGDLLQPLVGAGRSLNGEPVAFSLENCPSQVSERRVVVDVEKVNLMPAIQRHCPILFLPANKTVAGLYRH